MSATSRLDSTLFKPEAITEETLGLNDMIVSALSSQKPWHEMAPQELRDYLVSGEAPFPPPEFSENATTREIPGPAGKIPIRVFLPDRVDGVYLHIHGGGWVIGSAQNQDVPLEAIADKAGVAVVSVEYRMAPEHPYPAPNDDCEAVAKWLAENAKSEFGSERLLIGGESAGAHLSVVTLLRMRDKHGFTGFSGANLVFGVYDLGLSPSAAAFGDEPLVINTPLMKWFIGHYGVDGRLRDPDVSPIHADLADMPKALFTVGTRDPLLDDTLFMHARWIAAGNEAELAVYPGGAHGFTAFPIPIGLDAAARCQKFLKSA